jgi:hypothetical protein
METVIADTGFVVALANRIARHHLRNHLLIRVAHAGL